MTDYRMVARHVGYWRGANHRFSNVWRFTGTLASSNYLNAIAALKTLEQGVNYQGPGIVGGLWEIALYNQASGGVPVAVSTYFDPDTVGAWIAYTAGGYASHTPLRYTVLEAALSVTWPAGLSSSGKPVNFRKWFHSVPAPAGSAPAPELTTADQTSIANICQTNLALIAGYGIPMGNGSRLAASTPVVNRFYQAHQMPRGRRRRALVTASGQYTGPRVNVPPMPIEVE